MATKTAKKVSKVKKATKAAPKQGLGLLERLAKGPVICAEGYLFEFERRGYLQAGAFVPEVVLEHPDLVEGLHRDFVHAGSDVVEAFTYYAHRAKLRIIGRERDLERINRTALRLAKKVARETGTLLAGNICNTSIYGPDDAKSHKQARRIFDEQIGWAMDAGVDFIVGETYSWGGEALLALEAIRRSGKPAVITLAVPARGADARGLERRRRGPAARGGRRGRGRPELLARAGDHDAAAPRDARAPCAATWPALPVPYRTTPAEPTFQSLTDPNCACIPDNRPFPAALDPFVCNRYEIGEFGKDAYALGARYLGVCCGAGPHHVRGLAEGLGRRPPASRYSPDMSKHILFGTDKRLRQDNLSYGLTYRRRPGRLRGPCPGPRPCRARRAPRTAGPTRVTSARISGPSARTRASAGSGPDSGRAARRSTTRRPSSTTGPRTSTTSSGAGSRAQNRRRDFLSGPGVAHGCLLSWRGSL